jgi:hypothetical protein
LHPASIYSRPSTLRTAGYLDALELLASKAFTIPLILGIDMEFSVFICCLPATITAYGNLLLTTAEFNSAVSKNPDQQNVKGWRHKPYYGSVRDKAIGFIVVLFLVTWMLSASSLYSLSSLNTPITSPNGCDLNVFELFGSKMVVMATILGIEMVFCVFIRGLPANIWAYAEFLAVTAKLYPAISENPDQRNVKGWCPLEKDLEKGLGSIGNSEFPGITPAFFHAATTNPEVRTSYYYSGTLSNPACDDFISGCGANFSRSQNGI